MNSSLLARILAVFWMELRKTFFAKRGLWIYLFAIAPVALQLAHSVFVPRQRARLSALAAAHPLNADTLHSLRAGITREQVVNLLGEPYQHWTRRRRTGPATLLQRDFYNYTDGAADYRLVFADGILESIEHTDPGTPEAATRSFASAFQFFYLRLIVFFGCIGIFINLIRGEMLDKSLHFYLLTPVPREALTLGKFLAGWVATALIFTLSTALQWQAMTWQFDHATAAAFLAASGWSQLFSYIGVTFLACIGYGSLFLAIGLFFRNPIPPAAAVLLWESINIFLPATFKKLSLVFYLQSLCPVPPPADTSMTPLAAMLVTVADPVSHLIAIAVVLVIAATALALACVRSRRLQINYSAD